MRFANALVSILSLHVPCAFISSKDVSVFGAGTAVTFTGSHRQHCK